MIAQIPSELPVGDHQRRMSEKERRRLIVKWRTFHQMRNYQSREGAHDGIDRSYVYGPPSLAHFLVCDSVGEPLRKFPPPTPTTSANSRLRLSNRCNFATHRIFNNPGRDTLFAFLP
ncbi:hypothetical protein DMENIID0001_046450 [Sergentomyia squamirostris]